MTEDRLSISAAGTEIANGQRWPLGVWRRLYERVDIASLVAFRIFFGLAMCGGLLRFMVNGWVEKQYVQPSFFFKYFGFSWVVVWPAWGLYLHIGLLALAALCIALGLFYRLSVMLFFIGFAYLQLMDVTNYLNHYYLVTLLSFLMIFMPLSGAGSLDVWRKPILRRSSVPSWMLQLLRFQVALLYFGAALAKVGSDWLLHAQPLNIWLTARSGTPLIGTLLDEPWAAYLFSWGGFLYDLTIVFWLSWRRTRAWAYLAVLGFHGLTHVFFDIGMFPIIMPLATTLFFGADWPRRCVGRLLAVGARLSNTVCRATTARCGRPLLRWSRSRKRPGKVDDARGLGACRPDLTCLCDETGSDVFTEARSSRTASVCGEGLGRTLGLVSNQPKGTLLTPVALACYVLLQVLIPLRHLAYPGSVLWHEQGMRWSWKVMVREKNGSVVYHLRQTRTGRRFQVDPHRYLTPRQAAEMSGQPDLILQLAKHIGADFRRRGFGAVEVRAEARVSLNGRPAALLIDPQVDLLKVSDGFGRAWWILPQPQTAPIRLLSRTLPAQKEVLL